MIAAPPLRAEVLLGHRSREVDDHGDRLPELREHGRTHVASDTVDATGQTSWAAS